MRVSFNQPYEQVKDNNGYGYAARMCKESLVTLGHEVGWRDSTADVEINFIQPEYWEWTGPYRIGYLPWESTKFKEGWVDIMNTCDEMWTPSPVIADIMVDEGVTVPVKIYQHGVDEVWAPSQRTATGRFNILHHGAEALRKGGNDTFAAFNATLWDKPATLHMKMILQQFNLHDTEHIKLYIKKVPIEELVALYQRMDLFFYPSYGEGFGLCPLQAMATGMPVLITQGWAPYEHLLGTQNLIKSTMVDSPWPDIHPGQVWKPDMDDMMDKLLWHFDNREFELRTAEALVELVRDQYNWVDLTREAFAHLA
jgi:glycosyltransferase involved in cell wall biosynthesis